jgi:hypothetical protein
MRICGSGLPQRPGQAPPPFISGTSANGRPASSTARHGASGQCPASAADRTFLSMCCAKRRSACSSTMADMSSMAFSPSAQAKTAGNHPA